MKKYVFFITFLIILSQITFLSLSKSHAQTGSGPFTVMRQTTASSDDVNEDGSNFTTNATTVFVGTGTSTTASYTGLHFSNVTVPKDAVIISAHIEVFNPSDSWINRSFSIGVENIGNSQTFSTTSKPSQRTLLGTTVPVTNSDKWLANSWISFDDITSLIQPIINRSDWVSGNALSIIFHGTGSAFGNSTVTSFDGSAMNSPKLVITYSIGVLPTPTPGPVGAIQPLSMISKNIPSYASSGTSSDANDTNYTTYWNGTSPGWLAYDLSSIPQAKRTKVILAWYNDSLTQNYNDTSPINEPTSYIIEGNTASGGTRQVPSSGWVTLATVTGNVYHSRQHLLILTGYNWIRMNISAVNGGSQVGIDMDLHDASLGVDDDWLFMGDSITLGMNHGGQDYAFLIHAANTTYYPVYEAAGIGGNTSGDALRFIDTWMSQFPGKFISLAYGTNDALNGDGCTNPNLYYTNMATVVQKIITAGKIPIIPHIPYGTTANIISCGPNINAQIDTLYSAFPQIIKGPDFWTLIKNHPEYLADGTHMNSAGTTAMRLAWRDTMLQDVYKFSSSPSPTGNLSSPTPTIKLGSGDTNSDSKIDNLDLKNILQNWLSSLTTLIDQYGDGRINSLDFIRVIKQMPQPTPTAQQNPTVTPTISVTSPTPTGTTLNKALQFNPSATAVDTLEGVDLGTTFPGLGSIFTVEAFINFTGNNSTYDVIIGRQNWGVEDWVLSVDGGLPFGSITYDGVHGGAKQVDVLGVTPITPNSWHHIAFVANGSQYSLYMDGKLEKTAVQIGPIFNSGSAVNLFMARKENPTQSAEFHGIIDEVRISNVARYSGTIYTVPTNQFTPDLNTLGLWHLNEGIGTTVNDSSGHNYTGTIQQTPRWIIGYPF